jgi:hypothetical protein
MFYPLLQIKVIYIFGLPFVLSLTTIILLMMTTEPFLKSAYNIPVLVIFFIQDEEFQLGVPYNFVE